MSDMLCGNCGCGCRILPKDCLHKKDSRLRKIKITERPELFDNVNILILVGTGKNKGLFGAACFDELCAEISSAQLQANQYNEANPNSTDPEAEFWFYLPTNWSALLNNPYFQSMYAAYVVYYFFLSHASSEASLDGSIKHKRAGNSQNSGEGSENIDSSSAAKLASIQLAVARSYMSIFKEQFLKNNIGSFPCLPSKDNCNCYRYIDCNCKTPVNNEPVNRKKKPRWTVI